MRIVVRSALLLALTVGLPSIGSAQSRYDGQQSGYGTQQYGDGVVSTGTYSDRNVKWPDGWVRDNDGDDRYPDPYSSNGVTASQEQDQSDNPSATVEGDGNGAYRESSGDAANPGESDGGYDTRYGSATGTFQDFGGNSYSGRSRPSSSGRYGSTSRYGRGRVTNCYIDRRGRTICR